MLPASPMHHTCIPAWLPLQKRVHIPLQEALPSQDWANAGGSSLVVQCSSMGALDAKWVVEELGASFWAHATGAASTASDAAGRASTGGGPGQPGSGSGGSGSMAGKWTGEGTGIAGGSIVSAGTSAGVQSNAGKGEAKSPPGGGRGKGRAQGAFAALMQGQASAGGVAVRPDPSHIYFVWPTVQVGMRVS